jgi:hypothetical protein
MTKAPLGRRLRAIRKRIVASGVPLLDWDELSDPVLAEIEADDARVRRNWKKLWS